MIAALWVLAAAPWQALDAGALDSQVRSLQQLPAEARFLEATSGFLGTRYVLSPLGEGEGHDPDPLVRYDAVDCVTMVEQAMALSSARTAEEVLPALNHIRYAAEPSYEGRLHVMEAQWLPMNLERGLIEDVTRQYGGAATRRVSKTITAATWAEKGGASLQLPAAAQARGTFFIDIIPSERAPAALAVAPAGLLVVVVRADRPRLVSRITHVGVLVQKPEGAFLRHASRSFKRVVDEPIEKYLQRNLEFGAWTVEGVSLFKVKQTQPNAVAEDAGSELADAGREPPREVPLSVAIVDAGSNVSQVPRPCGCAASGASLLIGALFVFRRRSRR